MTKIHDTNTLSIVHSVQDRKVVEALIFDLQMYMMLHSCIRSSGQIAISPVSPMLCKKPALVGKVYMLPFTAVLTKKLWMGDMVPLYAFAAAVCSVHALSAAKFCRREDINDIDDNSLWRLREQLFFVVTVPACRSEVMLSCIKVHSNKPM